MCWPKKHSLNCFIAIVIYLNTTESANSTYRAIFTFFAGTLLVRIGYVTNVAVNLLNILVAFGGYYILKLINQFINNNNDYFYFIKKSKKKNTVHIGIMCYCHIISSCFGYRKFRRLAIHFFCSNINICICNVWLVKICFLYY